MTSGEKPKQMLNQPQTAHQSDHAVEHGETEPLSRTLTNAPHPISDRASNDLPIAVTVNGSERRLTVPPNTTLLDMLRWELDLTGSKKCCAVAECGACTVLVNGRSVNSCLVLAVEVDGDQVTTVEGLESGGRLDAVQEAFLDEGAIQCGFCIPGMVVSARFLLNDNPEPTPEQVREGLSGNLCRCAGYNQIVRAVLTAARTEAS